MLSTADKAQIASDIGVGPITKQGQQLLKTAGIPSTKSGPVVALTMHAPKLSAIEPDFFSLRRS